MKATFNNVFYLKKDKIKKDGTAPIFCRITIAKEAVRFNTQLSINPNFWDAKAYKALGKSKDALEINSALEAYITLLNNKYRELLNQNDDITAETLKNAVLGLSVDNDEPIYLLKLFQQHNEDMQKLVGISYTPAIAQKYRCVYTKLQNFIKYKYNLSDIRLKDLKHQFLVDFESYMRIVDDNCTNTVGRNMRLLKKIINIALNNGYLTANPFVNYKIRFEKTDRGYLTNNELQKIIQKKFSIERLDKVKDIFLFSCFTGIVDKKRREEKEGNILIIRNECPFLSLSAEWLKCRFWHKKANIPSL